jgi:hypothetical protein
MTSIERTAAIASSILLSATEPTHIIQFIAVFSVLFMAAFIWRTQSVPGHRSRARRRR